MKKEAPSSVAVSPTHAVIHLDHLRHNAAELQRLAKPATLVAVVKANAYGHGASQVAQTLASIGVHRFAVATLPEGIALRKAGITAPIHVFGAPLPEYLPAFAAYRLEMTVSSAAIAREVIARAQTGETCSVHIKVDTGMGRIGLASAEAAPVIADLLAAPNVTVAGIWTHFATADQVNDAFARYQWTMFQDLIASLSLSDTTFVHATNSGALHWLQESFNHPRALIRSGIALYGISEAKEDTCRVALRPTMTLRSRVVHVKTVPADTSISYGRRWTAPDERIIATVGAGYADGYRRVLTNRASVQIGQHRYPVAGTVCMDMFMVDLGTPPGPGATVAVGDTVTLFGEQGPSAHEVAAWAETIPYEIFCGVSTRVPRIYTDNSGAPIT